MEIAISLLLILGFLFIFPYVSFGLIVAMVTYSYTGNITISIIGGVATTVGCWWSVQKDEESKKKAEREEIKKEILEELGRPEDNNNSEPEYVLRSEPIDFNKYDFTETELSSFIEKLKKVFLEQNLKLLTEVIDLPEYYDDWAKVIVDKPYDVSVKYAGEEGFDDHMLDEIGSLVSFTVRTEESDKNEYNGHAGAVGYANGRFYI